MNRRLEDLLKFTEFTNLFADVKRKTILNKDGSAENNAQHSFQLAIIAWYISQKESLKLNIEKLIKYALVHDLVETFSGTFSAYERNKTTQKIKDESEKKSLEKIRNDFKELPDLIDSLNSYLIQQDKESKLIYALDKLIPILNIELNNHDFYHTTKTTYENMIKAKDKKISRDPTVYKYFKLLIKYLYEDSKFFWPANKQRDYSNKKYD